MTSSIHQLYKNLEKCVQTLEEDVKNSLKELNTQNINDTNFVALEASKDYHYEEILTHLKKIKENIKQIAVHDECIQSIQAKIGRRSKIDKNYIKKQVETFQKMGTVHMRENKPNRQPETSSMKFLESWEQILDEQEAKREPWPNLNVKKREDSTRKQKKVISSTLEAFLEYESDKTSSLETLNELEDDVEAVNDEIVVVDEDSKPRIVEVIYKKKMSI